MNQELLYDKLMKYYGKLGFSLGLHTTDISSARSICRTGLKTHHRELEGTVSIRGDMKDVKPKDLDFFFPYTDTTVVICIPHPHEANRVWDNLGGYTPICGFSKMYHKAQKVLEDFKGPDSPVLPNYFVLGYYDKDYNFYENPDNLITNEDKHDRYLSQMEEYDRVQDYIVSFDDFM